MEDSFVSPQVTIPQEKSSKHKLQVVPLILAIVLTAVVVGSGVYFLVSTQFKTKEMALTDQIAELKLDADTNRELIRVKNDATEDKYDRAVLLKTKFAYDILRFWGVEQVFQDWHDPNLLYFVGLRSGSVQTVYKFDATDVPDYLNTEVQDVPPLTVLITLDVSPDEIYYSAGVDGDKFVFYKQPIGSSPNPCESPMLYNNLQAVDTKSTDPVLEDFTASEARVLVETQKQEACLNQQY